MFILPCQLLELVDFAAMFYIIWILQYIWLLYYVDPCLDSVKNLIIAINYSNMVLTCKLIKVYQLLIVSFIVIFFRLQLGTDLLVTITKVPVLIIGLILRSNSVNTRPAIINHHTPILLTAYFYIASTS